MGGLDSRYLLSPANPTPNNLPIRSLTTIGTPHFGSPIADAVDDPHTPQDVKDAIGARPPVITMDSGRPANRRTTGNCLISTNIRRGTGNYQAKTGKPPACSVPVSRAW